MRTTPRCRKCGEPITFLHLVPLGKATPCNIDDLAPHWQRCKKTIAERQARRWSAPGEVTVTSETKGTGTS